MVGSIFFLQKTDPSERKDKVRPEDKAVSILEYSMFEMSNIEYPKIGTALSTERTLSVRSKIK